MLPPTNPSRHCYTSTQGSTLPHLSPPAGKSPKHSNNHVLEHARKELQVIVTATNGLDKNPEVLSSSNTLGTVLGPWSGLLYLHPPNGAMQ